jgi:predicted nicotinamide N-methyase
MTPLREPHPIASAFFAFHDETIESKRANRDEQHAAAQHRSLFVSNIRNSLGWRTRYASSAMHPVSIAPVQSRTLESDNSSPVKFHVRQVFPEHNQNKQSSSDDLGTGATVWPGSMVLLKYLEKLAHDPQQQNVLQGKVIADLGSGTAITSLASALLGARLVFCTDGCDPVVDLARQNIHNANLELRSTDQTSQSIGSSIMEKEECQFDVRGCKIIAKRYLWGDNTLLQELPNDDEGNAMDTDTTHIDIILSADCIIPKLYPIKPLIDAIDELSGDNTVSYLSYEQRYYDEYSPSAEFRRLASLRNLKVEVVPSCELNELFPASDIEIWKVTRDDVNVEKNQLDMREKRTVGINREKNNHEALLVTHSINIPPVSA